MRAELRRSAFSVTCAVAFFAPLQLWGQDASSAAPPVDDPAWQTMSAAEFATAAKDIAASDKAPLAEIAWKRFLVNSEFVQQEQLTTVLELVRLFGAQPPSELDQKSRDAFQKAIETRLAENQGELKGVDLYDLGDATKAMYRRATGVASARLFAKWMAANDWKALRTQDLYNLFGFVNADALDRTNFSARWTGTMTAPREGEYVFRQAAVYSGRNARIQLWIGDALVLDSSSGDQKGFASQPVKLAAQSPVPIRVELVHEAPHIEYSIGAPMALISWETAGRAAEIIPTSALTPPADQTDDKSNGLRGEYFADTGLKDLRVTRLDPTLDLIWTWPPTASAETAAANEVFAELVSRVTSDEYLRETAGAPADVQQIEFDRNLWRIAYRMSGTQRLELIDALLRNPDVLQAMSSEAIGRLYRGIYMLPGPTHFELFGEWALSRPQPRTEPGWLPGWGEGSYDKLNIGFYWAIGTMMQGPYAASATELADGYLVRPDGACNLAVAYALAFAARENEQGEEYLARLSEHIDDASLDGDKRLTWCLAKAFAQGALRNGIEPLAGFDELQEAMLHAESDDAAFWALQEAAARLASVGLKERLVQLVEPHRQRFKTADQVNAINKWLDSADSFKAKLEEARQAELLAAEAAFAAEVQRRRQRAADRGDSVAAERIDVLLQTLPKSTK